MFTICIRHREDFVSGFNLNPFARLQNQGFLGGCPACRWNSRSRGRFHSLSYGLLCVYISLLYGLCNLAFVFGTGACRGNGNDGFSVPMVIVFSVPMGLQHWPERSKTVVRHVGRPGRSSVRHRRYNYCKGREFFAPA